MQRYSASTCTGGVSTSVGGSSSRESTRLDSSFASSNFSAIPRRASQLTAYRLKCDKEALSTRLGPPDFYPQTPNCLEETLTREYVQSGYKETVEGIEEAREIQLTHVGNFVKPDLILKCKEAIRKRLRAINESRAQKRKAGQVYGMPLAGPLLCKSGVFPDQKPCSEDFRKKWIEGLAQQQKPLRSLAENIPHGYRKKSLFENLIRRNVPLLRATWFIKVTYLNQIRPTTTNVSSGNPDKANFSRTELWTKDVIEYLQQLLDEFSPKDGAFAAIPVAHSTSHLLGAAAHQRNELLSSCSDVEEPTLQFKWSYMMRLVSWHYAEGLLLPSLIIEWSLNQLQEKESVEIMELFLPIVYAVIESIALSQSYVRLFVDIVTRYINSLCPGSSFSTENPKKPSLLSSLVEMLQYFILAVPDSFVALDCFTLPSCMALDSAEKFQIDNRDSYHRHLSFGYIVSSLQKQSANLTKVVNSSMRGHGMAKIIQALDKTMIDGDLRAAYTLLFEDLVENAIAEVWIAQVSPSLRSSFKWITNVNLSLVCSVFFLCEWATCDFRNCRSSSSQSVKLTGGDDFCQIYIAVLLLKLKMESMHPSPVSKNESQFANDGKATFLHDKFSSGMVAEIASVLNNSATYNAKKMDLFRSPGLLHDIIVCWLDQHEFGKDAGFKRLQIFTVELIRFGIFFPQVYVRQLILGRIMDWNECPIESARQRRHQQILKQLPGSCLFAVLKEARNAETDTIQEVVDAYSNERRLVLLGRLSGSSTKLQIGNCSSCSDLQAQKEDGSHIRDSSSPSLLESNRKTNAFLRCSSSIPSKRKNQVADLKDAISTLLHFPNNSSATLDSRADESQGSTKRPSSFYEGALACGDCRISKKQKLDDERSSSPLLGSPVRLDEEEAWWARNGSKFPVTFNKVEQTLKSNKPSSRGRRKTQSLAQLAATRVESSQGASTSHVCDNKISCPHHKSGIDVDLPKDVDLMKFTLRNDIGKSLKRFRVLEKKYISSWLVTSIKELIEGNEKADIKVAHSNKIIAKPVDERNSGRWRLGEDDLSSILYLLEVCSDLVSVVEFLIWLLPKVPSAQISSAHVGRNTMMMLKSKDSFLCDVGELFLLSSIQRYENVLLAANLLPDFLNAAMRRVVALTTSSGRPYFSHSVAYARNLLKKYRDVASVAKWEKNFRGTCDPRLLQELDAIRSIDGNSGISPSIPVGIDDFDEYLRQKISGRVSRIGPNMKELVQRRIEEIVPPFYGKERKLFTPKGSIEKSDDGHLVAQEIVLGLVDCIRQNGGPSQEVDSSVVVSAISAIVGSIGMVVAKLPDFATSTSNQSVSSSLNALNCVHYILNVHIYSLSLLKEALGDRVSTLFDIALASEASSSISGFFSPSKPSRSQFQSSPESHDSGSNQTGDIMNNSAKAFVGRATKVAAAVSALVVGAIIYGVTSLERMIIVFKLKEGLDIQQFIRNSRSSSNGTSRSFGSLKLDHSTEIYTLWFRMLIGNCRTVFDGLVVDILGESYLQALWRMQRMLPLNLVFSPAYSIFAMVIWKPYILNSSVASREDSQLYQYLSTAIGDAIKHRPFRDLCLHDTRIFYDLLASDMGDFEFASMLELHSTDKRFKAMVFVPLRARLFFNAVVDCKMPLFTEDVSRGSGPAGPQAYAENETKLLDQLVHVLDTLQPAKFHWQWVELRLILNEQALVEKIETQNMMLVDALRSLSPNSDNFALSENERNFIEIVLTRLLVRPDAASLYSEVVHLLGKSLEESLLQHTRWFLAGNDVLLGRKSIRQRLVNVAHLRGLSIKAQFWKPWGWSSAITEATHIRGDKKIAEINSIEEGEVVEEGTDVKKSNRVNIQFNDTEGSFAIQLYVTERALADLVLPCIDQASNDTRNSFAGELIKQLGTIEQQINALTRGGGKLSVSVPSGAEAASSKGSNRKSMRGGGSPGLGRRLAGLSDSGPPSADALRASLWLRLQFLLRFLPIIYADRESSSRNMRHTLALVLLRLLGTRIVQEDASCLLSGQRTMKKDDENLTTTPISFSMDLLGDGLFDKFLCVFHALLSNYKPSWLKPKPISKTSAKSPRADNAMLDREVLENLQSELDRMELPPTIQWRLQAAMPILPPSPALSLPCLLPVLPNISASLSQPNTSNPPAQRTSLPSPRFSSSKQKAPPSQEQDMDIDPWTLLEDGTGSISSAINNNNAGGSGGDHSNLKACSWLKGTVRVRRADLTYVGAMDEGS